MCHYLPGKFNHPASLLMREQLRGLRRGLRAVAATLAVVADGAPAAAAGARRHRGLARRAAPAGAPCRLPGEPHHLACSASRESSSKLLCFLYFLQLDLI